MSGDHCRVPQQTGPPDGVDPGQWALESYRKWRARIYGEEQAPNIPEMDELLASIREESSD